MDGSFWLLAWNLRWLVDFDEELGNRAEEGVAGEDCRDASYGGERGKQVR